MGGPKSKKRRESRAVSRYRGVAAAVVGTVGELLGVAGGGWGGGGAPRGGAGAAGGAVVNKIKSNHNLANQNRNKP
jgi:hypothetical protein